jgi:type I site-specific restriction endonuclease
VRLPSPDPEKAERPPGRTGTQCCYINSHHPDEVVSVTRGYGQGSKPEDFLDTFSIFIRSNLNQLAALTIVVQRPRELTRAQLRALRLELDRLGYSEANLRRAWADAKNEFASATSATASAMCGNTGSSTGPLANGEGWSPPIR